MAAQYPPNDENKDSLTKTDTIVTAHSLLIDASHSQSQQPFTVQTILQNNNTISNINSIDKNSCMRPVLYQFISVKRYLSRNPSLVQIMHDHKQKFWRVYCCSNGVYYLLCIFDLRCEKGEHSEQI